MASMLIPKTTLAANAAVASIAPQDATGISGIWIALGVVAVGAVALIVTRKKPMTANGRRRGRRGGWMRRVR